MVGHRFIEELVKNDEGDQFEIATFCEESKLAYDRVHLTSYFSGSSAEDLSLVKPGFYEENKVQVFLEDKATDVDLAKKTVKSANGVELNYDKLILATGSFPFVPPVPGHERDNCFVYRTLDDLDKIAAAAKNAKIGAVVGGGLLGLEAAKALKDLGLQTHVVEFAPRLMAVQVDDGGGAVLRKKIEELGVAVHTEKNTKEIIDGDGTTHKMCFADGEELNTDLIVFSAGIRPQDELARSSGLEIGPRGGITINNYCQTSDEDVYAIGECALWDQRIFGLIAPGWQMSKVAADHLVGKESEFAGADMSTKLKLMGVDVASVGDAHCRTEGSRSFSYSDEIKQVYKKIVVSADNKTLLGAVLVGDAEEYGTLLQLMLNKMPIPESPDALILPQSDGAALGLGVDTLPETAQICSCNNVTKGDICCAIE
ncbi:MAG: FAD-dependent oxidoreductase, partial [Pseudomonadales bacterium]|nr:FAD-dependent oxidoreductase [Pseudomonadales bacterium]